MNDTTDSTLRDDMNIPQTLRTARKNRGLTQREVAELVGVSIEAYKGWEGGRHHPRSENVAPLAQALGISTDELMMEAQQRSISEDLRALFNAADKLPDDKKRQLRTAIKGMLLAISQEQLDEGSSLTRETKVGYHLYPTFQPRHPRPPPPKPHQRARNDASRKRRLPARQKNSRAATGLRDSPRDMAGRNGSRPHIVRTVVLRAERNGRSTEVRLNKVVRAPPLLSRPSPGVRGQGRKASPYPMTGGCFRGATSSVRFARRSVRRDKSRRAGAAAPDGDSSEGWIEVLNSSPGRAPGRAKRYRIHQQARPGRRRSARDEVPNQR